MNILMVTLAYEPATAFGGPVKVVQNNARELARRGHRVTVYCTNRLDRQRKMALRTIERWDQGVRIVYHNTWFMGRWRGNFGPSFTPGMVAYLLREGRAFDLVHINEARAFTTVAAAFYAQVAHIPYVIQAHGSFIYGLRAQRLKRLYDRAVGCIVYNKASRVIALRLEEIAECQAVGIPRDKISVIGSGIDLTAWRVQKEDGLGLRARFGVPADAHLALFLGRLDRIKGPDLLVEALAQLEAPNLYCLFAGPDDGYRNYVRKLVIDWGLSDRVIFTGLLRNGDVHAAYAAADIFVLPSRFDTFPMAVVEALASGVPILTTEACQIADLIKDRAGLVTPVNAVAIAEGLRRLLFDPALRNTYAREARVLAEAEFSIQKTVDRLEEVYQQVLAGCRRS